MMKTKNKHPRIKISFIDEEGKEIHKEEEIAISEYKSYNDMEERIIEIEQKVGRFMREEATKKKSRSRWEWFWQKIRNFFGIE